MLRTEMVQNTRRIVVKIGSSSITKDGHLSRDNMARLVRDIAAIKRQGIEVVLVTSGAISAGAARMDRKRSGLSIPEKQALAAVGQTILMNEYRHLFLEEGLNTGQILMTEDDVKNRRRFINARNTINALLQMGVVPVINENDSVVIKEIKVGDNDTLSAHVASMVEAQLLVLLSDIDGFYNDLSDAKPLSLVSEINDDIISRAGGSGSIHGTGGMLTKIRAAHMMLVCGRKMIIAKADVDHVLQRILEGEQIGTLFAGTHAEVSSRKRIIAFHSRCQGQINIDEGAVEALRDRKKSLLASGVTGIEGSFGNGDVVDIAFNGQVIARGLCNYTCDELERIKGHKTDEIAGILGEMYYEEVVHRDNMLVF